MEVLRHFQVLTLRDSLYRDIVIENMQAISHDFNQTRDEDDELYACVDDDDEDDGNSSEQKETTHCVERLIYIAISIFVFHVTAYVQRIKKLPSKLV